MTSNELLILSNTRPGVLYKYASKDISLKEVLLYEAADVIPFGGPVASGIYAARKGAEKDKKLKAFGTIAIPTGIASAAVLGLEHGILKKKIPSSAIISGSPMQKAIAQLKDLPMWKRKGLSVLASLALATPALYAAKRYAHKKGYIK